MEKYLLGCDWGTSSFRLGLYSVTGEGLIDEIQSGDGISGIHRHWQNGNYESRGIPKDLLFRERLLQQIQVLSDKTSISLRHTPVLISGMASSSIGIDDVPYADLPFYLDGSQVKTRKFPAKESFPHEMILISGVQSEHDVMRGEETQLIGLWSLLADSGNQPDEAIVIFPGTHSKHVYVKNNRLVQFKSFMTGELYQVIGNNSILKDSIKMHEQQAPSAADMLAFKTGIRNSSPSSLLHSLFTVRTNQLFNRMNKHQNTFYLSGLLIGNELNDLHTSPDCSLFLCSGKNLQELYTMALEEMGLAGRTSFIANDLVDKAAITGQKIIYEQYVNDKLLNG